MWVPQSVADEINARGDIDPTAMALREHTWLVAKPPTTILSEVLNWRLGAGETSVLALALQHGLEAIIDDLGARKCAASLGIPVRGTLGIVLVAKQRGIIPLARPVLHELLQAGLYLSGRVLAQALARVGE